MKKVRILKTAEEVVEAFGGTGATAEWAGIGDSSVSNWLARGFIPPGWHFRMSEHLEPQGFVIAKTAFGHKTSPSASNGRRRPAYQAAM